MNETTTHPFPTDRPAKATRIGYQWTFAFDNGYSASVVRGEYTYGGSEGLWELAVKGRDGHIDYDTPITDDVLGYLDEAAVVEILEQIALLP